MDKLSFLAFGISFVIGVVLCPVAIPILHRMKFGQNVRDDGPESHLKKQGTPTMGGVVILIAMLIGTGVFAGTNPGLLSIMIVTFAFGLIGFLDDILKIAKKQSEGLKAWQKMALQIIVTAAFIVYISLATPLGCNTIVPFVGEVNMGFWFYPMAAIAILGTVNGANFTDGLDGLASSVTIVIGLFLTVAAVVLGYGFTPASLAMTGALMAFLIFNIYPARVFMGDTGSLALGGFVAAMAFMMKVPIFLILIAFIYLAEIVSVILQVVVFKLTHGKRLFKMAPIHHHFELCGWSEMRVVIVFTITTVILCVVAYLGLVTAL